MGKLCHGIKWKGAVGAGAKRLEALVLIDPIRRNVYAIKDLFFLDPLLLFGQDA